LKKESKKYFFVSSVFIAVFAVWTVLVKMVDVKAIGPQGSEVGFAEFNQFVHQLTGVNMRLYIVTDWLGLVPIAVAFRFAVLGLVQWIKRKSLKKVDYSLFVLGGFYTVVILFFVLFESMVINYRPVLIEGILEASYPSSTTLLVMCVMPTAIMQINERVKSVKIRKIIDYLIVVFIVFMVLGRIISGVHWISDIIGGALLSVGLVCMYYAFEKMR